MDVDRRSCTDLHATLSDQLLMATHRVSENEGVFVCYPVCLQYQNTMELIN